MRQIGWALNSRKLGKSTEGFPLVLWPGGLHKSGSPLSLRLVYRFRHVLKATGSVAKKKKKAEAVCLFTRLYHLLGQWTWASHLTSGAHKHVFLHTGLLTDQTSHASFLLLTPFHSSFTQSLIYVYACAFCWDRCPKSWEILQEVCWFFATGTNFLSP